MKNMYEFLNPCLKVEWIPVARVIIETISQKISRILFKLGDFFISYSHGSTGTY